MEAKEEAVKLTPHDHPDRAMYLSYLSNALHSRFEQTGSIDDVNAAVEANEEAVKSTPHDHPNRRIYLNDLGDALQS